MLDHLPTGSGEPTRARLLEQVSGEIQMVGACMLALLWLPKWQMADKPSYRGFAEIPRASTSMEGPAAVATSASIVAEHARWPTGGDTSPSAFRI